MSFVLLAGSARRAELRVQGSLRSNYRSTYDILVRPRGSKTALERSRGLVRDNYLSGIFGGISFKQWHQIVRIPGVSVAAPVAIIGYVLPAIAVPVWLNKLLTKAPDQLYRVRFTLRANGGLSTYPNGDAYVYFSRRVKLQLGTGGAAGSMLVPGRSQPLPYCGKMFDAAIFKLPQGPFRIWPYLACYSSRSPAWDKLNNSHGWSWPAGGVGAEERLRPPLLLAAIDPVQEAKLVHLDRTVVSGRYLREDEGLSRVDIRMEAPVLASTRSFLGETLEVTVERLRVPAGTDIPVRLSSKDAFRFITGLDGRVVEKKTLPLRAVASRLLSQPGFSNSPRGEIGILNCRVLYVQYSDVRYRSLGPNLLAPKTTGPSLPEWRNHCFNGTSPAPVENKDTQFRSLHVIQSTQDPYTYLLPRIVGRFDPSKLPSFSPLSRVPLGLYYPPELEPADKAARQALHGQPLLPTQNVGGYEQQPPLLLLNLKGLKAFMSSTHFDNVPAAEARAPLSSIRVRVKGVTGPNAVSEARIRLVAQQIHDRTGLQVDVTAGSSPHPLEIALAKGKFGRPPLLLREGWSKKGVSVSFLTALDRKDLALFALILVVCGFFLGNGAFASVRARRAELGVLSTFGWSPSEVFRAVLGELALVGLLAGLVGTGIAAALVAGLDLSFPLPETLYVLPIAAGLATLAGLVPAWRAARGRPLDAIRPPVIGGGHGRRVRGTLGMALVNLARLPGRTLVGAAGLLLGVAALTVLVGIERGFQGSLVGTLLGNAISVQVRPADFVALGLTVGLAALSAADVLYLNLRERQVELVTLQTLGWSDRELRLLVGLEALLLAGGASLVGACIGLLVGVFALGVGAAALGVAVGIAGGGAALVAFASSLLPLLWLRRLAAPEVLAAE